MLVNGKRHKTLWVEKQTVKIIDQTKLPFQFKIIDLKNLDDFCDAIFNMRVRGAPLIGVTASFGMAVSINKDSSNENLDRTYEKLISTRPTAVNLKWALDIMKKKILKTDLHLRSKEAIRLAKKISSQDENSCEMIGKFGSQLIKKIYRKKKSIINILTHCNAGWLAAIDWGTALSPIYKAKRDGIPIHVWVDETRPRNQGASLTAWELKNEDIPYTIVTDNAGGHLMHEKRVDLCLVGSDRTAINGDVCNKIGTYLKALAAHDNKIPFFVALPSSTIDRNLKKGLGKIKIEERSSKELSHVNFYDKKKIIEKSIYFKGANIANPAFDVTPSKYITKLITEFGICEPNKKGILKNINKKNVQKKSHN